MLNSIVEAIAKYSLETPDKLCIADRKREYTYREYWENIYGYAKYLRDQGIKKGDCIVVRNSQSVETLIAGLAIQLIGAIFVPVEKAIAEDRMLEIIHAVEAKCYIAHQKINADVPFEKMEEVTTQKASCEKIESVIFPDSQDIAEILFTTGTTGVSKGIVLTHLSVVAVSENVIDGVEMDKDNVELIPVPLSHSHGLRRYYSNMLNGSTVVILNGVAYAKVVFDCIDKYKVNSMDLVPAALTTLLNLSGEKFSEYRDQFRYIQLGSAPIPENDRKKLRELLPKTRLYNFYGTTESGCSCIIDFNKHPEKRNCIGKPSKHASFVFFNDEGIKIKATKENPGLLACSGAMNMLCYHNEPKLSDEVFSDGFIKTQDIAYQDENGMIYLIGRQGDVIECGGTKIAPTEIEEAAMRHPAIKECVCVPVDNQITGKEPKLYVVLESDYTFDYTEIYQFLKLNLEAYKVPKKIEEINEVPRTYNGKIDRKVLIKS